MSAADLTGAPTRAASLTAVPASYVEWGPIFAGAVLAAALSLVMFAFAGGVGLAISSPWQGPSGAALGVVSVAWTMIVLLFSSMAGAYVAGRLRSPRADATADEVEVRDGTHGLLVWATGLLLGALAAMALALAAQSAAAAGADDAPPAAMSYEADKLIRGVDEDRAEIRAEVDPILANAALTGSLPDADRAHVASLIADASDVSETEARTRVDAWAASMIEDADSARKVGAVAAFLLAATTLTAGAAAYFAGGMGGRHRDRNSPFLWTRARAV